MSKIKDGHGNVVLDFETHQQKEDDETAGLIANVNLLLNLPLFPNSYAIPLQGLTIGNFTLPQNPVILGTVTLG